MSNMEWPLSFAITPHPVSPHIPFTFETYPEPDHSSAPAQLPDWLKPLPSPAWMITTASWMVSLLLPSLPVVCSQHHSQRNLCGEKSVDAMLFSKPSNGSPSHSEQKPKSKMAWKAPHKLPSLSTSLTFPLLTFFLAYFAPATQSSLSQPTQSLIRAIALAIPFAWNTLYSVIFMTPSILLFRSFLREAFLIILSKIALFPHSTHYYLASYPASFFMAFIIT